MNSSRPACVSTPIKDFGAIEEGEHRFCEIATGNCEGIAKLVIVWRRKADNWRVTRVLSYGHRTMTDAEKAAGRKEYLFKSAVAAP